MSLENALRTSIALQLICIAATVVLAGSMEIEDSEVSSIDAIYLIQIVAYIFALFLMFTFKVLGRQLFLVTCIVGIPLSIFAPEYITPSSNLYELLIWFSGLLDGLMLAIVYLTDLRHRFVATS